MWLVSGREAKNKGQINQPSGIWVNNSKAKCI